MGQPNYRLASAIATTVTEFAKDAAQQVAFYEITSEVAKRLPLASPDELRQLREFLVQDSVRTERLRKTVESRIAWQQQALVTIDGRLADLEVRGELPTTVEQVQDTAS